jgi:hypothetical protein
MRPARIRRLVLAGGALLLIASPLRAASFDHRAWGELLERYVDAEGRVAYRELAATDGGTLDRYLGALAAARPEGWPRADQLAFWLNAYNAVIVKAVLEGYSAESILSRYRLFSRCTRPVAGPPRTPDEIEKRVIHAFGDSRMHFALVCASSSCPKLRRRAWTGETLDADLDEEARRFVRDPSRNEIRAGAATLKLSKIFDWYRDDFGGGDETVRAYVARYLDEPERRWLEERRPGLEYVEYDWTMNAQPGQRPR